MNWVEKNAEEMRTLLNIPTFARRSDADRLLEYASMDGVRVKTMDEIDCLAEICPTADHWLLKLSASMDPALRADVIMHEMGHRYTCSRMTAICHPAFSWWWRDRDECNAALWCAHFRIPTGPLCHLLDRGATWEDLAAETGAPDGLLVLKLRWLKCCLKGPVPRPPEPLEAPPLAWASLRITLGASRDGEPLCWGVAHRQTGRRWIWNRPNGCKGNSAAYEELCWDLVGWSERRFWAKWHTRLQLV